MYETSSDYEAGKAPTLPEAEDCARLWVEATKLYAADALAASLGRAEKWRDRGQALCDLRGERRMLRRLCTMIDADPEAVAQAIEACITRGHGAGLHPSKPKRRAA